MKIYGKYFSYHDRQNQKTKEKKENPRKYNHLIRVLIAMEKQQQQKHWEKRAIMIHHINYLGIGFIHSFIHWFYLSHILIYKFSTNDNNKYIRAN